MEPKKREWSAMIIFRASATNHNQPRDLKASGIEVVLAQALYAIVGAVSLEKGGDVANKVVKERIFTQLGL